MDSEEKIKSACVCVCLFYKFSMFRHHSDVFLIQYLSKFVNSEISFCIVLVLLMDSNHHIKRRTRNGQVLQ